MEWSWVIEDEPRPTTLYQHRIRLGVFLCDGLAAFCGGSIGGVGRLGRGCEVAGYDGRDGLSMKFAPTTLHRHGTHLGVSFCDEFAGSPGGFVGGVRRSGRN